MRKRKIKLIRGPVFQCPYCKHIFETMQGAKKHLSYCTVYNFYTALDDFEKAEEQINGVH